MQVIDAQTWETRCDGVQRELQGGWKRCEEGEKRGEAGEGVRQWCGFSWEVMSCWSDNKLQMEAVNSPLECVCHGLHIFCVCVGGEGYNLK